MDHKAVFLVAALAVATSACSRTQTEEDEGSISFERNSEFSGPELRVFVTLEDGREVSVNTADNAVRTRASATPIPGHQAREWTFVKNKEDGASVAYALVSWDGDDPADYLMAGWWAEFPDQKFPDLNFRESRQYAIVDGPEIDHADPPVLPTSGQASYAGPAGGLYTYVPGTDWGDDEGAYVLDEYQGTITLTADFEGGTLSGCVGCQGDLVTSRAHFNLFLGDAIRDVRAFASDYELHLGETAIRADGTFEQADVTVMHPERNIVKSLGSWGGSLSNISDDAGDPRLATGFTSASFEEADASEGRFFGTFVGLSETFAGRPRPE